MRQRAALSTFVSAQTGTVLIPVPEGGTVHVAGAVIAAAGGNTATPAVTIRIGAAPVFRHPGVPAGGGLAISGFDVVGYEDVLIDCDDPGGSVSVMVATGA